MMPRVIEFLYEYSSCVQYEKPGCLLLSWWENCRRHPIMTKVQIRQPALFWVGGGCFRITAIWAPAHTMNFIFAHLEKVKFLTETRIRFYCHMLLARSSCSYSNKASVTSEVVLALGARSVWNERVLARLFASTWRMFRMTRRYLCNLELEVKFSTNLILIHIGPRNLEFILLIRTEISSNFREMSHRTEVGTWRKVLISLRSGPCSRNDGKETCYGGNAYLLYLGSSRFEPRLGHRLP